MKIRTLYCACCGSVTRGQQFHNQDSGYGLCPSCVTWIKSRNTYADEEFTRIYGVEGVNYCVDEKPRPLTAYKITTEKGVSWSTSMAAGVTLGDAEKYFIGHRFNVGAYDREDMQTAVKVEKLA